MVLVAMWPRHKLSSVSVRWNRRELFFA